MIEAYSHPQEGIWIDELSLAPALKKGEAELYMYGVEWKHKTLAEDIVNHNPRLWHSLRDAFHRLIGYDGLRIKRAIAREFKWLGISLLFCWLPFRHRLESKIDRAGYGLIVAALLVMVVGALAEIVRCWRKGGQLLTLWEQFKISSIKHFPWRPRPPRSRTEITTIEPNLKLWGVFLAVCVLISSIVPIPGDWIVVRPLGGQAYTTQGPTLIRPFSSWHSVPKSFERILYIPLRLREEEETVTVLKLRIRWRVTDPLEYEPQEWARSLDKAIYGYIYRIQEYLREQLASEVSEQEERELIILRMMGRDIEELMSIVGQSASSVPFEIMAYEITDISLKEYGEYYRSIRQ